MANILSNDKELMNCNAQDTLIDLKAIPVLSFNEIRKVLDSTKIILSPNIFIKLLERLIQFKKDSVDLDDLHLVAEKLIHHVKNSINKVTAEELIVILHFSTKLEYYENSLILMSRDKILASIESSKFDYLFRALVIIKRYKINDSILLNKVTDKLSLELGNLNIHNLVLLLCGASMNDAIKKEFFDKLKEQIQKKSLTLSANLILMLLKTLIDSEDFNCEFLECVLTMVHIKFNEFSIADIDLALDNWTRYNNQYPSAPLLYMPFVEDIIVLANEQYERGDYRNLFSSLYLLAQKKLSLPGAYFLIDNSLRLLNSYSFGLDLKNMNKFKYIKSSFRSKARKFELTAPVDNILSMFMRKNQELFLEPKTISKKRKFATI